MLFLDQHIMIIGINGREKMARPKSTNANLSEKEKIEYRNLTDYIQELYLELGTEPPWALFMTQIKDIKKGYNLSYTNILHILQYMTQIEGIDIRDRDTLGLIPYFVNKTEKYIEDYKESKKIFKQFKFQEETIKINPKQFNTRRKKKNENFS